MQTIAQFHFCKIAPDKRMSYNLSVAMGHISTHTGNIGTAVSGSVSLSNVGNGRRRQLIIAVEQKRQTTVGVLDTHVYCRMLATIGLTKQNDRKSGGRQPVDSRTDIII